MGHNFPAFSKIKHLLNTDAVMCLFNAWSHDLQEPHIQWTLPQETRPLFVSCLQLRVGTVFLKSVT